jgi:hypothetical protein
VFNDLKKLPVSAKAGLAIMLIWATYVGGDKEGQSPASQRISQLVVALSGGGLNDPSGVIGTATQLAAIQMFNEETAAIVAAASNVIASASSDYAAMTNQLASTNLSVAYIGYDLPRAAPPVTTNHNITATIVRTAQNAATNTLSAWVYFSEAPTTNVNVLLQASVAANVWSELVPITNSYPATTTIDSLPCIRYDYTIPTGMRGVPLKPETDLQFGGFNAGQYLRVPVSGVVVETNGVATTPYTGWDYAHPEPWGTNLAVRYVGGVAIEARVRGTNYTGVITQGVTL